MTMLFPVAGPAKYSDDWGAARSGGRSHEGTDILAAMGTPVVAVEDGELRFGENALGGTTATLALRDGTYFYYAHLSATEGANRRVRRGEVIGYVGDSGNAKGGVPHLHFEVHPQGGAPVNPYPLLQAAERGGAPTKAIAAGAVAAGAVLAILVAAAAASKRGAG